MTLPLSLQVRLQAPRSAVSTRRSHALGKASGPRVRASAHPGNGLARLCALSPLATSSHCAPRASSRLAPASCPLAATCPGPSHKLSL